jgi:hypothetical protein
LQAVAVQERFWTLRSRPTASSADPAAKITQHFSAAISLPQLKLAAVSRLLARLSGISIWLTAPHFPQVRI